MNNPVVIGYSLIPVGEYWDKDVIHLAADAIKSLSQYIDLREVDALYVGNMLSKFLELQASVSVHIASHLGLDNIHTVDIEAGDASGLYAIIEGISSVISGRFKFVIAGGVEKCTDALPARLYRGVSLNEDIYYVDYSGVTNISLAALAAKFYLSRYNVDREDISYMSVLDHSHGARSKHAYFKFPVKIESILNAPRVSDPLTLFDISPNVDGAAFLLITTEETAKELGLEYVRILAYSTANNPTRFEDRDDPLVLEASKKAFEKALEISKLSISDIDFMEVHDSTSITGLLILESLGFHKIGESASYVKNGYHSLEGKLPINTFGGLKARGNPLGATGAYAATEVVMQILGRGGDNQVEKADIGLVHSMNGFDNSASVIIFGGV